MFSIRSLIVVAVALWTASSLVTAQDSGPLSGSWKATATLPDGNTAESILKFTQSDSGIKGTAQTADDAEPKAIDRITIDGKKVTLERDIERDGQKGLIRVIAEQTEKGKLAGKWSILAEDGTEQVTEAWSAVKEPEAEKAKPEASAAIVGTWNAKAIIGEDRRELDSVITVTKDGDKLKAHSKSERFERDYDSVSVDGNKVIFKTGFERDGNTFDIEIAAEFKDEDHLTGEWKFFNADGEETGKGPWQAVRALRLDLAGTWNVVAITDDGNNEHRVIFEESGDGYRGRAETDDGRIEMSSVTQDGNDLKFSVPFGEGTIKVAAKYQSKNTLTGKWTYRDASDLEQSSGDWTATKVVAEEKPAPEIAGEWELEVKIGENTRDYQLRISQEGDAYKGVLVSPRSGEHACDSVTFKDGQFEMKITRDIQGSDIEFNYQGKLSDDGNLSGTFVPKGYEDQFSGEWTGKRKK